MKHDWEYKKLADLSLEKLSYGSGASAIDYDNNIRYVRITDITDDGVLNDDAKSPSTFDEKYLLNEGDLLFARSGATVGKTYLHSTYNGTCIYAGYLIRFVPNKNIVYPPYVFLYTKSNIYKSFVKKAQNAVAQPNINAQQYGNLSIPVPPLPTQQSIVSELDSLSKIIADCKETLKDYDALEQSIFYDMFGDITDIVPLSEYVNGFTTGKSLAGEEENKYKVLKSGAVTYDEFDSTSVKNYPLDYNPDSKHLVKKGDLLVSRMNTAELVGACAFVWDEVENLYLPDRIWKAILNDNCNPIFVWKAITASDCKRQIRDLASGTSGTMKNISMVNMLTVKVKKVDLSLQQAFASKMEFIRQMKSETKKALQEAETLFNARMDYWFNG